MATRENDFEMQIIIIKDNYGIEREYVIGKYDVYELDEYLELMGFSNTDEGRGD